MTKYGYLGRLGSVPGIAPSQPPTHTPTPGTPLPLRSASCTSAVRYSEVNSAVGLISVAQLSLYTQIWDIRGMTEVYNLA